MRNFNRGPKRGGSGTSGAAENSARQGAGRPAIRKRGERVPVSAPTPDLQVLDGGAKGSFSSDTRFREDAGTDDFFTDFDDSQPDAVRPLTGEEENRQVDKSIEPGLSPEDELMREALLDAQEIADDAKTSLDAAAEKWNALEQLTADEFDVSESGEMTFQGKDLFEWYSAVQNAQKAFAAAQENMNVILRDNPALAELIRAEAAEDTQDESEMDAALEEGARMTRERRGRGQQFEQNKAATLAVLDAEISRLKKGVATYDVSPAEVAAASRRRREISELVFNGQDWEQLYASFVAAEAQQSEISAAEVSDDEFANDPEYNRLEQKARNLSNIEDQDAGAAWDKVEEYKRLKRRKSSEYDPRAANNSTTVRAAESRRPGSTISPDQMRRQLNS